MNKKLKILYFAYNGLTCEAQKYLSYFNLSIFDITVVVPLLLNLYGQVYDFNKAQKIRNVKYIPLNLKKQPYEFFSKIKDNKELDEILIKTKPDLIIIQSELFHVNAAAIIESKIKCSPQSKILNFAARRYVPKFLNYYRHYFFNKKIIRNTQFICCRNKKDFEWLRKDKRFENNDIFYNYWGVDTELFHKMENKTELRKNICVKMPGDNFILGYVGRIVEEKGLHLLFEALKLLPEKFILVYCGEFCDPKYEILIKSKEKLLNKRCFYLGSIGYSEMAKIYSIIDLLVIPTNRGRNNEIEELFGRIIPEAMLCKTLVIGSDNGSIPEVINNKDLIFKQNSISSLKEKILKVSALEQEKRIKMAENSYQYALYNYTSARYVERLQKFIINKMKNENITD